MENLISNFGWLELIAQLVPIMVINEKINNDKRNLTVTNHLDVNHVIHESWSSRQRRPRHRGTIKGNRCREHHQNETRVRRETKMSLKSVIVHEVVANHDALRFGLDGVKGDIVGSHPLQSRRDSVNRLLRSRPSSGLFASFRYFGSPASLFSIWIRFYHPIMSNSNANPNPNCCWRCSDAFGFGFDQTSRFWEEKKRMGLDFTYGSAFNLRRDLDAQILSRYAFLFPARITYLVCKNVNLLRHVNSSNHQSTLIKSRP